MSKAKQPSRPGTEEYVRASVILEQVEAGMSDVFVLLSQAWEGADRDRAAEAKAAIRSSIEDLQSAEDLIAAMASCWPR